MLEYAIFNDEGCIEAGFHDRELAERAINARYFDEEHVYTDEVCPDHPEQPRSACKECNGEDESEDAAPVADEPGYESVDLVDRNGNITCHRLRDHDPEITRCGIGVAKRQAQPPTNNRPCRRCWSLEERAQQAHGARQGGGRRGPTPTSTSRPIRPRSPGARDPTDPRRDS